MNNLQSSLLLGVTKLRISFTSGYVTMVIGLLRSEYTYSIRYRATVTARSFLSLILGINTFEIAPETSISTILGKSTVDDED